MYRDNENEGLLTPDTIEEASKLLKEVIEEHEQGSPTEYVNMKFYSKLSYCLAVFIIAKLKPKRYERLGVCTEEQRYFTPYLTI